MRKEGPIVRARNKAPEREASKTSAKSGLNVDYENPLTGVGGASPLVKGSFS